MCPISPGSRADAASVARAFEERSRDFIAEPNPETIATAIMIGNSVSGKKAFKAIYDTKGHCITVTDEEIIAVQQLLSRREGVRVEPASVVGLKKIREHGIIDKDERVVCICMGNGLKNLNITIKTYLAPMPCANDIKAVEKILG